MKNPIIKKSVSMLMALLMFVSVFAVTAGAEELLPEANGGAIYNEGSVETWQQTLTGKEEANGGAIYNEGQPATIGDINFHPAEGDGDGGAIFTSNIVQTQKADTQEPNPAEGILEEGDTGIPAPAEDEDQTPAPDADQTPAPDADTEPAPDADENPAARNNTEPQEAQNNAEAPADDAEATQGNGDNVQEAAEPSIISAIDITATAIPHPEDRNDPDIEGLKSKEQRLGEMIGDAIIKIGESTLPFGRSISNFFRNNGKRGEGVDPFEQTVDLATDAANFIDPVFGPLASVARDVVLKIWHLF